MSDNPEYFPILIFCAVPVVSPYNERTPFAIGQKFEERIAIADIGVKIIIYERRTIEIKDPVRELVFEVTKLGHLIRRATLIAKLTNGGTEGYVTFINLESPVDNI